MTPKEKSNLFARLGLFESHFQEDAQEQADAAVERYAALLEHLRGWEAANPEFAAQMPWAEQRKAWEEDEGEVVYEPKMLSDSSEHTNALGKFRQGIHDVIYDFEIQANGKTRHTIRRCALGKIEAAKRKAAKEAAANPQIVRQIGIEPEE